MNFIIESGVKHHKAKTKQSCSNMYHYDRDVRNCLCRHDIAEKYSRGVSNTSPRFVLQNSEIEWKV
jgi:hypothetical protein